MCCVVCFLGSFLNSCFLKGFSNEEQGNTRRIQNNQMTHTLNMLLSNSITTTRKNSVDLTHYLNDGVFTVTYHGNIYIYFLMAAFCRNTVFLKNASYHFKCVSVGVWVCVCLCVCVCHLFLAAV